MTDAAAIRWLPAAWASAVFFHLAANSFWLAHYRLLGLLQLVWFGAAIALAATHKRWLLAVIAVLHLVVVAMKAPAIPNHELMMLLVEVAGALTIGRQDHLERWAGAARTILVVAYSAFAFSKLNTDFFNPVVSCAIVFVNEVGIDTTHPSVAHGAIWSTVLAETTIAVLLWIPATRHYGAIIGLVVHFFFAIDPVGHVYDFSAVLYILFALFIPGIGSWEPPAWLPAAAVAVIGAQSIVITLGAAPWLVAWPIWLAASATTVMLAAQALRRRDPRPARTWSALTAGTAMIAAIAVANAVVPYLGVKTASAFNMYSNQSSTNHYFLPDSPQRDVETARIVSADSDYYRQWIDQELNVPIVNLADHLEHDGPTPFTIEYRDGTQQTITAATEPEELLEAWSVFAYRIAPIRSFNDADSAQTCRRYAAPPL